MIEYQDVRMELKSSKDVQKYLKKNDLVILPVGCFEMHGPDMPLGCDTFIDWAQALLLAREWKCLALPPVYYTFPGASGPWPGTVDMPIGVTQEYVSAIVRALLKNGFKRIVLCGSHGPLAFVLENVVRDLFQQTGHVVLHIKAWSVISENIKRELGYDSGEAIVLLGALRILGLHGAYRPETKVNRPIEFPFKSISALRKLDAVMPWTFSRDYQHTGLHKAVKLAHADQAAAAMKKAAHAHKDFPRHFAQYQQEMKRLYQQQPWKQETIWTQTK